MAKIKELQQCIELQVAKFFKVIGDNAERGVALNEEYNKFHTMDEDMRQ